MDYYPPYLANYMTTIKNSIMWSSIVFHCASTDARILCAKLSTSDTSACSGAFGNFTSSPTVSPRVSPTVSPSQLSSSSPSVSPTVSPSSSVAVPTVSPSSSPSNPSSRPTTVPTISSTSQYCATFQSSQSSGASGYFAMEISNGVAKYSYSVDLRNFSLSSSCSGISTTGLKVHLHQMWSNTSTTSSGGATYCGSGLTGGHYDPTYACSGSSQYSKSVCSQLSRTSTKGYNYGCNSTVYGSGNYASW